MSQIQISEKLAILADAAKYDASCASSGTSDFSTSRNLAAMPGRNPAPIYSHAESAESAECQNYALLSPWNYGDSALNSGLEP